MPCDFRIRIFCLLCPGGDEPVDLYVGLQLYLHTAGDDRHNRPRVPAPCGKGAAVCEADGGGGVKRCGCKDTEKNENRFRRGAPVDFDRSFLGSGGNQSLRAACQEAFITD